jgi:hypothetical protein
MRLERNSLGLRSATPSPLFHQGFSIGLSQAMHHPSGGPWPSDVAVDWIRVTNGSIPEPTSLILMLLGIPFIAVARLSR